MQTKKQIALYVGVGIAFTLFLLAACNNSEKIQSNKTKSVIQSPFQAVNIAFLNYKINPSKDTVIKVPGGSTIVIKANSLVDSLGNPLKEYCEVSYREFMNAADIIAAGIPMAYKNDEANVNQNFTSAGMFEIIANSASGKQVGIAENSSIQVNLASNETKNGYSSFYLNEQTGAWIYTGEEQKRENIEKLNLNKQIEKLKRNAALFRKKHFVLNTASMLDVYYKDDYEKIYTYFQKKNAKLPKRLLAYGVKSSELYSYSSVVLNKLELPANMVVWENMGDVSFPEWTKNGGTEVTQIKGNIYELAVRKEGFPGKIFKARIKAVMSIKHLFAFSPDYWKSSYDKAMEEIKKEEERLAQMAEVERTLQINKFGIYNCDKFYNVPEAFTVMATFQLPVNENTFMPETVYYISKRDKSLIPYKFSETTKITLCKDPTATIITVLPNDIIAEINSAELMGINKSETNQAVLLQFKEKGKVSSVDDIKRIIGI